MIKISTTPNQFNKDPYQTQFDTFPKLVEFIKSLKITLPRDYLGSSQCPKATHIYINPWSFKAHTGSTVKKKTSFLKTGEVKAYKECADHYNILIADIDSGYKAKAVFNKFKNKHPIFIYASTGNTKDKQKYRAVIPIAISIDSETFSTKLDKAKVNEYFAEGIDILDSSMFARARGFVAPVDIGNDYFEYECFEGEPLDLTKFLSDKVRVINKGYSSNKVVPFTQEVEERIKPYVDLYINTVEGDSVTLKGKQYDRNTAFFLIQKEIAKYCIPEADHLRIAEGMNIDGRRNSVTTTVEDARNALLDSKLLPIVTDLESFYTTDIVKLDRYLPKDAIKLNKDDCALMIASMGAGKSYFVLNGLTKQHDNIILAVPTIPVGKQLHGKNIDESCFIYGKTEDKRLQPGYVNILTYNQLINLNKQYDLSDWVVVVDEIHRLLNDSFRPEVIEGLLEYLLHGKSKAKLCLSGTYNPSELELLKFNKIVKYINPQLKTLQISEVVNAKAAIKDLAISAKARGEKLVCLHDNKSEVKALATLLEKHGITVRTMTADDKDDAEFDAIFSEETFDTDVLLHTQVMIEGVSFTDESVKNVVAIGRKWNDSQLAQYFARIRNWDDKCNAVLLLPKPKDKKSPEPKNIPITEAIIEQQIRLVDFFNSESDKLLAINKTTKAAGLSVDNMYQYDEERDLVSRLLTYPYQHCKGAVRQAMYQNPKMFSRIMKCYGWSLQFNTSTSGELTAADKKIVKEQQDKLAKLNADRITKEVSEVLAMDVAELHKVSNNFREPLKQYLADAITLFRDNGKTEDDIVEIFQSKEHKYVYAYFTQRELNNPLIPVLSNLVEVDSLYTKQEREQIVNKAISIVTKDFPDLSSYKRISYFYNEVFKTYYTVDTTKTKAVEGKKARQKAYLVLKKGK